MVTGDRAEVAESVGAVIGRRRRARGAHARGEGRRRSPRRAARLDDHGRRRDQRRACAGGRRRGRRGRGARRDRVVGGGRRRAHRRPPRPARRRASRSPVDRARIARQSVVVGMGLSVVAMVAAAFGYLPPVWGAAPGGHRRRGDPQRAPGPGTGPHRVRPPRRGGLGAGPPLQRRAPALRPELDDLRAGRPTRSTPPIRWARSSRSRPPPLPRRGAAAPRRPRTGRSTRRCARALGGDDPTGAMSRGHIEIGHQVHRLGRLLDEVPPDGPDDEDLMEMRRLLYGLARHPPPALRPGGGGLPLARRARVVKARAVAVGRSRSSC